MHRLEQALRRVGSARCRRRVPLLAALLRCPCRSAIHPCSSTPQRQRQKTRKRWWPGCWPRRAQQPVLLVWEDLHWADPSTLELLSLLLDQAPTARLLTLLTCRPEFHPPWAPAPT